MYLLYLESPFLDHWAFATVTRAERGAANVFKCAWHFFLPTPFFRTLPLVNIIFILVNVLRRRLTLCIHMNCCLHFSIVCERWSVKKKRKENNGKIACTTVRRLNISVSGDYELRGKKIAIIVYIDFTCIYYSPFHECLVTHCNLRTWYAQFKRANFYRIDFF